MTPIIVVPQMKMQDYIDAFEDPRATIQDVVGSGTEKAPELLHKAAELFEQYDQGDVVCVCAAVVGMIFGNLEGLTSDHEHNAQELIGHEQRLKLFNAQVMAVFRGAYQAAQLPDCPGPKESKPQ